MILWALHQGWGCLYLVPTALHYFGKSEKNLSIYAYTLLLETSQRLLLHMDYDSLHLKSCYGMVSLRTSQVKNMNTYKNHQDLTVFIETSFHKREGKFSLSRDCGNRAKVTRITYQMVCYFPFFFFVLCPSCSRYD